MLAFSYLHPAPTLSEAGTGRGELEGGSPSRASLRSLIASVPIEIELFFRLIIRPRRGIIQVEWGRSNPRDGVDENRRGS